MYPIFPYSLFIAFSSFTPLTLPSARRSENPFQSRFISSSSTIPLTHYERSQVNFLKPNICHVPTGSKKRGEESAGHPSRNVFSHRALSDGPFSRLSSLNGEPLDAFGSHIFLIFTCINAFSYCNSQKGRRKHVKFMPHKEVSEYQYYTGWR